MDKGREAPGYETATFRIKQRTAPRWNADKNKWEHFNEKTGQWEIPTPVQDPTRPHVSEAMDIAHSIGLPAEAAPFIERLLTLEARLAHFESIFPASMLRQFEAIAGKDIPAREAAAFAAPQGR